MTSDSKVVPILMPRGMARMLKEWAISEGRSASSIVRGMLIERMLCPKRTEGDFEPYALVQTERTVPTQPTLAIVTGASDLLYIPLDASQPPMSYFDQAVDALAARMNELGSDELPFWGRPTAIVVHFRPDQSITYDLPADLVEQS